MRRQWKLYLPVLSFVLLAAFAFTSNSRVKADDDHHVTFTTIDVPGATTTAGREVTPALDAFVGEYRDTAGVNHGFLLSITQAWKINPRGDIVGPFIDTSGLIHGYLLSAGTFSAIDFPDAAGTLAFGINPRGDIVGAYCPALPCNATLLIGWHGFLLSKGEFTPIDFPGARFSRAFGINPRGDIVGGYRDFSNKNHGFLISKEDDDGKN